MRRTLVVASFWVYRPVEHPGAFDYPSLLRILDRSCQRLGLRHVVLTDHATRASQLWPEGIGAFVSPLPGPLMQACTTAQANWLEAGGDHETLFVGADCILLRDPAKAAAKGVDLCLSYRHPGANYAINNAFMLVQHPAKVAPLYRRIADRCGEKWCDDQRAIRAELEPMPPICGVYERAGLSIGFVSMKTFNRLPRDADDPCRGAVMVHFRGKQHATGQHRKDLMIDWAKRWLPEAP